MKFLTLVATTALFATPALAADAVVYNEPTPAAADTFSWTGGYIGVNAGYAGGKFKHPFSATGHDTFWDEPVNDHALLKLTSSGFVGGVQAGYNWQFDNGVILGAEADFQGTNLKGEVSLDADGMNVKAGTKVNWFGTVRARLGFAPVERLMVYGTGGLAYGKVKSYADFNGAGISKSKTKAGWTVGGGAEYAITNNWTLKSEYLYTDLGKTKLINFVEDGVTSKLDAKVKFHTVRVGLNYKF